MAIEVIDTTTPYPNGEFGDPILVAMGKINRNFAEIGEVTGDLPAVIEQVNQVKEDVVQLQADIEQDLADTKAEIQQTVDTALTTINEQVDALEASIPGQVDSAIAGRIPGKNRLINGNFDYSQRAVAGSRTSAVAEEFYTADRWVCGFVNVNGNWGIGGTPLGQIQGSRRFLGYNVASVPNNNSAAYIGQKIENCDTLAGKLATLSFWARSSVAGKKVGARLLQLMGTGGNPSANTSTEATSVVTLTTTFQRYSFTFTLPSMEGKTRGDNGNDSLFVVLDLCANSTFYGGALVGQTGLFEFAQVQLEEGTAATGFDARPLAVELALCQRYYEKSYDVNVDPRTASVVGYSSALLVASGYFLSSSPGFKVPKRVNPAVTAYRYTDGVAGSLDQYGTTGSLQASIPASITNISVSGFEMRSNGTGTAGNAIRYHWAADAEL